MQSNIEKILLTICIPTFNRSKNLNNLMISVSKINNNFLKKIEILISDNNSNDDTKFIVSKFLNLPNIKYIQQSNNIGAAENLIYLYNLAKGKWVFGIGDDDIISEDINLLEKILEKSDSSTYFLLGTHHLNNFIFINFINDGEVNKKDLSYKIFQKSLFPFGYIGHHLLPNSFIKNNLNSKIDKSWVHISLFLKYFFCNFTKVQMIKKKILEFSPHEKKVLFWDAVSECKMAFRRLNSLNYIEIHSLKDQFLHSIFFLRELYSLANQKRIFNWGLLERDNFLKDSNDFFKSIYSQNIILSLIHRVFFLMYYLLNRHAGRMLSILFKSRLKKYEYEKNESYKMNININCRVL